MHKHNHISTTQMAKRDDVVAIKDKLLKAKSVVIVNYKGLTVSEDTALRAEFRNNNVEYRVLKNTLVRRAFNEIGQTAFDDQLNGTTSVAFAFSDEVAAAKVVEQNAKKLNGKIESKCGFVDGSFIDANGVKALAALPPKEELIAKMLGSLNAPISGLVGVLSATLRSFVYAVKAVQEKKASE